MNTNWMDLGRVSGLCLGLALMLSRVMAAGEATAVRAEPGPLSPAVVELVRTNAQLVLSQRMAVVTNAAISQVEKVQGLLLMIRGEEREGQRKIAHAVMRHVDDDSFVLVRRLLMDPGWHAQIHSVWMTTTLKQKNAVKMPALLELARMEKHPLQDEARQLLGHLFKTDHGENWGAWEKAMTNWLAQHPE